MDILNFRLARNKAVRVLSVLTGLILMIAGTGLTHAFPMPPGAPEDAYISINAGSGSDGIFIIGDSVVATWDNSAPDGNNISGVTSVTVNYSAFGGGLVAAEDTGGGIWQATYPLSGAIEATNLNVAVTACTETGCNPGMDSSNAQVDTVAPTFISATLIPDTHEVDLTWSEAVNTTPADYSSFTGGLAGHTIEDWGNNLSTNPQLYFDGDNLVYGGTMQIGSSLTDLAGNPAFPESNSVFVSDGTAPGITHVYAEKQDGNNPAALGWDEPKYPNIWYYYSADQSIRFVLEADEPLYAARACIKSLTSGTQMNMCSPEEFMGEAGSNYVNYTNDLGSNKYEFVIPIGEMFPEGQGAYVMNLYLVDAGGEFAVSGADYQTFNAVFGINPRNLDERLNNENTTDWSTIADFTDAAPLVFSAQVEATEAGRITLYGSVIEPDVYAPMNLTDMDTINGLINLGANMTVSGDVIRLNSDALSTLDGGAEVLMHVNTGTQPGLVVKDNNGDVLGYVSANAGEGDSFLVGGDSLNNFNWTPGDGDGVLTFNTTGFSEFDVDNIPPTLLWARIIGPNTIKLAFSEPVTTSTEDYSDLWVNDEMDPRNVIGYSGGETDLITLTFDGEGVSAGSTATIDINAPVPASVEDLSGNDLATLDNQPVLDGQNPPDEVYVDLDWTGANDAGGHEWGYDAFSDIASGVGRVAENGTVYVAGGEYNLESPISIRSPMTLQGDVSKLPGQTAGPGPNAPQLYGACDKVVAINSDDVTFKGFLVDGDCSYPNVRIGPEVSGVTISDNELTGNYTGVGLSPYAYENTISNNIIYDNYTGITFGGAMDNTVTGNEIYDNNNGVLFKYGGSEFDPEGIGYGVIDGNLIQNNHIYENGYGIDFSEEVYAGEVPASIDSNTIDSNYCDGIYISYGVSGVDITGNDITNNGGDCFDTGIYTNSADGITVHNNTISSNEEGVYYSSGERRMIDEEPDTFDATRNYWGAANGPYNEELNPNGDGDSISSNVDYWPYYVDDKRTTFAVNTEENEIPLETLDPVILEVPEDVNGAGLDVSSLLTGTSGLIPQIEINSSTSAGDVDVNIPAGTTVTGEAGWTGIIHAPTVKPNSSVTVDGTVSSVIELGFDDIKLSFDKGVRIRLAGQAGRSVGYTRGGVFTEITSVCSADSQVAGDALAADGDCKITVGGDMIIWTKHFTSFVAFSPAGSAAVGGGGGGSAAFGRPACSGEACLQVGGRMQSTEVEKVVVSEEKEMPFKDVKGHWSEQYVSELYKLGAAQGWTKTLFAPDRNMTRGDLVVMVVKAFKLPLSKSALTDAPFSDVPKSSSVAKYIQAAKDAGIVTGYTDGSFKPSQSVSRAEALKIVLTASKMEVSTSATSLEKFKDVVSDAWYARYVGFAKTKGVVAGYSDGRFGPADPITRAQCAKVVDLTLRLMEK